VVLEMPDVPGRRGLNQHGGAAEDEYRQYRFSGYIGGEP
jgi:hypothetical protein